ncbi:MAG: hypothetical protein ACE5IK_08760 [Acidobacteriota bacterium]
MILRRIAITCIATCMMMAAGPLEARAAYGVTPIGPAPEDAVPAAVRAVLNDTGVRVDDDGEPVVFVWLRAAFPLIDDSAAGLGVSYGTIMPGMLLGVATFARPWTDYRHKTLPAGTYALRYAVQPADGNHMGVSVNRDFLIVLAFADDAGPDELMGMKALVDAGKMVTSTNHPAVIGLFPVYDEPDTIPAMVQNDLDHWMLVAPAGDLTLALVIDGDEDPDSP